MSRRRQQFHTVAAALPLTVTFYAADGSVLFRKGGLLPGRSVDVPQAMRKKVARTETMDRRGVIVDTWTAPWETDDAR
jgi:hypothetical protein